MKKGHAILISFALLILSCHSTDQARIGKNANGKSEPQKFRIQYSENLETLALIYNLSTAGDYLFAHNPAPRAMLARKLTKRFEAFKNHISVQKLNFLLDNDFVDSYDILLAMHNGSLPRFQQYADYPTIYYENDSLPPTQVKAVFDDFNEAVKAFYKDANLKDYFKHEAKPLYAKLMQEVDAVAPANNYINLMEQYYGIKRNSYTILVSAFSFNGIGRSLTIRTPEGINIYQLVTSNPAVASDSVNLDDLDSFKIGYTDKAYFREIAMHELGHSFFHEALRENQAIIAKVNSIDYLFTDSLRVKMRTQGYVDWAMCFEEHLVRLGEISIEKSLGNADFVKAYTQECLETRGFIYLQPLQEIMSGYERNRERFKTIGDFIPTMLEELNLKVPENG